MRLQTSGPLGHSSHIAPDADTMRLAMRHPYKFDLAKENKRGSASKYLYDLSGKQLGRHIQV